MNLCVNKSGIYYFKNAEILYLFIKLFINHIIRLYLIRIYHRASFHWRIMKVHVDVEIFNLNLLLTIINWYYLLQEYSHLLWSISSDRSLDFKKKIVFVFVYKIVYEQYCLLIFYKS